MALPQDDEKLRILEARASPIPGGRRKSWELVAEETAHSKRTMIEVNRWFQGLPWEVVNGLPDTVQRLRDDYVDHLAKDDVLPSIQEDWPHGYLSGTEEILRGDAALRWATERPQQPGDEFSMDLGTEKPLKTMRFIQGPKHLWDFPKHWSVILADENKIVWEVDGGESTGVKPLRGFIEVDLEETMKIRTIGVTILQPRLLTDRPPATCWAVDKIELS